MNTVRWQSKGLSHAQPASAHSDTRGCPNTLKTAASPQTSLIISETLSSSSSSACPSVRLQPSDMNTYHAKNTRMNQFHCLTWFQTSCWLICLRICFWINSNWISCQVSTIGWVEEGQGKCFVRCIKGNQSPSRDFTPQSNQGNFNYHFIIIIIKYHLNTIKTLGMNKYHVKNTQTQQWIMRKWLQWLNLCVNCWQWIRIWICQIFSKH